MSRTSEAGNILVYILIGVILIGLLTVAVRQSGDTGKDIDQERLGIKATEVQRYGSQLQTAISNMLQNGVSESDLRFAHPDANAAYGTITTNPANQVFGATGGNAPYRIAPAGIGAGLTDPAWEFFASTAIPQTGSDRADLVAVLPDVSLQFCEAINKQIGLSGQPVDDAGGCVYDTADRFTGTFTDGTGAANVMLSPSFSRLPAAQACVQCADDSKYYYFYVLMAR